MGGRCPVVVALDIHHLVWDYVVNRRMADYGEAHSTDGGMSPAVSVPAVTIGGLDHAGAGVSVS
jgi:hypothetical protein